MRRPSATSAEDASQEVREYFERLPELADPEPLAGLSKTCLFDVDGAGTWLVQVDNGAVSVYAGDSDADCRVTLSAAVFQRILRGQQKPTSAYLTGKMKVRGELAALMRMQVLLEARG
jgi:putative sterol carrier protein